ncbi:MAG: PAS domain-containing protein, partial [Eubacterium sp.]
MTVKIEDAETRNSIYDAALRNIYDELYEINVTQNEYRIIYHADDKYITPPDEGCLSKIIPMVAEKMIDPRDKKRFINFFDLEKMKKSFQDGKSSLMLEVRKLWYDQDYHWSSLTVFPVEDKQKDEILLCLVMDISEKKRMDEIEAENKLLHKKQMDDERYRIIIDQTETIVCEWMREGNKRYYAPQFKEKFKGNYDENRDLRDILIEDGVIHPDDVELVMENFDKSLIENHRVEVEVRLSNKENRYIWCKVTFSIVFNEEGQAERVLGIINDIDQSKRIHETLRYQAEFDELTGI